MTSKTIILSSEKKFISNSPRAILTLINNNSNTEGKIRLYNLDQLNNSTKVGVYYNNEVLSANLIINKDCYTFSLPIQLNLSQNIYCALIDCKNSNSVVLSGGEDMNFNFTNTLSNIEDNDEIETLTQENEDDELSHIENDDNSRDLDNFNSSLNNLNEEDKNLTSSQNQINEKMCLECKNCIYKEFFYSHQKQNDVDLIDNENAFEQQGENESAETLKTDEIEEIQASKIAENENKVNSEDYKDKSNDETEKFLLAITEQLDELFKTYPLDNTIMNIIPNSKIVRIDDSFNEINYIIGVIYENNEIKYLVYGVPAKYNSTPPQELGNHYQWLALDAEDPLSDGYFMIYQNASDGKIVPIKVE